MASIKDIKKRFKKYSNIGNRCSVYVVGCAVCESYHHLYEHGRFPYNYEELSSYIDKQQAINNTKLVWYKWSDIIDKFNKNK